MALIENSILKRPDCQYAIDQIDAWRKHKEHERQMKVHEQKQIREMFNSYWPWRNRAEDPRRFNNVHFDDTNPVKSRRSYPSPKRGLLLGLGKPGGGAPMITSSGRKLIRTHEDPMLRFQFGDLRRTVDNTLRYKTSVGDQLRYKNELDELVKEKQLTKQLEMKNDLENDYRMGYTTNEMMTKDPDFDNEYRRNIETDYEKFKDYLRSDEPYFKPYDPIRYPALEREPIRFPEPQQQKPSMQNVRLSPLTNSNVKERGDELVPIIREKRTPIKAPLGTTDVTRGSILPIAKWRTRNGSLYLNDLAQQMKFKTDTTKETKLNDNEKSTRHFNTWNNIWGRPGHGAPNSVVRRGCLDRLLYPSMLPIGVN